MKILMTGFTALQRGPVRRGDIRKIDVPARIADELRQRGHEVDWRPVELGEDLDGYDAAWVNLARPISMNSRVGAFGAMWTLASGVPCVGFYDDWQSPTTVQNDFKIMQRRPNFVQKHIVDPKALREAAGITQATYLDRQPALDVVTRGRVALEELGFSMKEANKLRAYRFYEADYDIVEAVKPQLNALIDAMAGGARWASGMVPVCPMYAWGDRSIVQRLLPLGSTELIALDPSQIALDIVDETRDQPEGPKRREWLLAALMPHDAWLKKQTFGWPVWNTGSQSMIKRLGTGERLFSEQDVVRAYGERWGVLSPPYKEHAGSGWWRSRFLYAADMGCVVLAHPDEVGPLGEPYSVTAAEVEGMSDVSLERLADLQQQAILEYLPRAGAIGETAEYALNEARANDKWEA